VDPEQLGKVVRADPRTVWVNEALDFTPWLQEHIDELADRIGAELEVDAREAPWGPSPRISSAATSRPAPDF
jgi:hypothetical protein